MLTETPTQALYRKSAMQVEFERIQAGDERAITDFYRLFQKRTAFYIRRYCFLHIQEDVLQESFVAVLEAIRKGSIRNPASIWSFAATTIKYVAACMGSRELRYLPEEDSVFENTIVDPCPDPEERINRESELQAIRNALACLSPLDREILRRFYLEEQTKEEIMSALSLSLDQFRNRKVRAKERLYKKHRAISAERALSALAIAAG